MEEEMLLCLTSKSTKSTQRIDVESPGEKLIHGAELVPTRQPENKSMLGGMSFELNCLRPGLNFPFAPYKLIHLSENETTGRIKAPAQLVRLLIQFEVGFTYMNKANRPIPITIQEGTCNFCIIIWEWNNQTPVVYKHTLPMPTIMPK